MRKVRGFTAISLLVVSLAGTTAFAAGSGTKFRGGGIIGQLIQWVNARFLTSPRSQSRLSPPIPAPPPPQQPEGTESRLEPPIPIPTTT